VLYFGVKKQAFSAIAGSRKFAVFERLPSFIKQRMGPKKQSARFFIPLPIKSG
jgi:hypothetical protein